MYMVRTTLYLSFGQPLEEKNHSSNMFFDLEHYLNKVTSFIWDI